MQSKQAKSIISTQKSKRYSGETSAEEPGLSVFTPSSVCVRVCVCAPFTRHIRAFAIGITLIYVLSLRRHFPFSLFLTGTEINGHAITECGFVNRLLAAKERVGNTIQIPNKEFNKSSSTADCRLRSHQNQTASSRCFILSRGNIAYWQRTSMFTQTSQGGLLTLNQGA